MYLLDAEEATIAPLRSSLGALGDSLVVVGGEGLWHVHVHVDDVGAAVEAGIRAGRPHQVRVSVVDHRRAAEDDCEPMRSPASEPALPAGAPAEDASARGVVVVSAGPGLTSLFAAAGAQVVTSGPGHRCSTGEILAAIASTHSRQVVILPNDPQSLLVAEAAARAARDAGMRVAVIPSRAQIQGLAAIAVHEPSRSFDDDVVQMTSAAGHARHGAVTVATRDAMTMAGPCHRGDVLGVVDADFAVVGDDLEETARVVLDRLLDGGGEMVTLVSGADAEPALVRRVAAHLDATRPSVEVVVHEGGQERYPLLIGVE
jgi:dihydroxyacetone kinase-like predicted kinase